MPKNLGHDIYQPITAFLGDFNEMPLWTWGSTSDKAILPRLGALLLLVALFCALVGLFVPGGRLMGILFQTCPHRLTSYSVNIAGSLVGVWLFSLTSALMLPSAVWFAGVGLLALPLLVGWRQRGVNLACLAVLLAPLLYDRFPGSTTVWSPYQRLRLAAVYKTKPDGSRAQLGYQLDVNDTFYQRIMNLSPAFLQQHVDLWLEAAFGSTPCSFFAPEIHGSAGGGGPTFLAARDGHLGELLAAHGPLRRIVEDCCIEYKGAVPLGTDDWPYLYLESRTIPRLYIIVMGILLVGAMLAARRFVGDFQALDWPFFAMGAAFLLVEVQSVSKMAMLFGSTWVVNAVVISCVMVTILLAIAFYAWSLAAFRRRKLLTL